MDSIHDVNVGLWLSERFPLPTYTYTKKKIFSPHLVPTVRLRFLDSQWDCIIVFCLRAQVFKRFSKRKHVSFFQNKKQNLRIWRTFWAWICLKEEQFRKLILLLSLIGLFLLKSQLCSVLGTGVGSVLETQNWHWIQAPLSLPHPVWVTWSAGLCFQHVS